MKAPSASSTLLDTWTTPTTKTSASYSMTENGFLTIFSANNTGSNPTIYARAIDNDANNFIGAFFSGTLTAYASEALLTIPVAKGHSYSIIVKNYTTNTKIYFTAG